MSVSSTEASVGVRPGVQDQCRPLTANSDLRHPSRILRDLTDLFASRATPTGAEIMRYEDIASRLAADADVATLTYVAAKLAAHPAAPVVLLDTLLGLDRTCAKILSEHCPRLSPKPLLAFAEGTDAGLAAAVARRPGLTSQLAGALAQRSEIEVLRALAANKTAHLTHDALKAMVRIARDDAILSDLILEKTDDLELLMPLFLRADPAMRMRMVNLAERQTFSAAEINRVKTLGPALHGWIMRRSPVEHRDGLARELARQCGLQPADISSLIQDRQGYGLALLFAAIGLPADDAVRLFFRCESSISHSIERIRALKQVVDSVPAHAALKMISAIVQEVQWQGATPAKVYLPTHDVSARPLAGRASPTVTKSPARAVSAETVKRSA